MNEADSTDIAEAVILEKRIQAVRNKAAVKEHRPTGRCQYCEEPFTADDLRIFCDADCRDDNVTYKR